VLRQLRFMFQAVLNTHPTPTGRMASLEELMVDLANCWSVSIVSTVHGEGLASNIRAPSTSTRTDARYLQDHPAGRRRLGIFLSPEHE
jgi:hypothetical protein